MDEIDAAQQHIERELEQRIAATRNKPALPETKHCMNCGEPVQGRRYCDDSCKEDAEHRARKLKHGRAT